MTLLPFDSCPSRDKLRSRFLNFFPCFLNDFTIVLNERERERERAREREREKERERERESRELEL